ncbi:MAG: class II fumarate hydratase [Deltaproteobacteria bacterium]|nr:class II fumarate hydratase [Deltaproteobacteria bacterium]
MSEHGYRVERDGLGEVYVPHDALFGSQTQRAIDNFKISGWRMPRPFLHALGLIKRVAAEVNAELRLLDGAVAAAIATAAREVAEGAHDGQFPVDVLQTGSGTGTNVNANEVIAAIASAALKQRVHPNDHVNLNQSSNDVIPSALRISAYLEVSGRLTPALQYLQRAIAQRAREVAHVVKTGRTHLMDAPPIRLSDELEAWAHQLDDCVLRLADVLPRLAELPLGATAVGSGLNAPVEFGALCAARIAQISGRPFATSVNRFAALACQDTAAELSGQLRVAALALLKIGNDLRWMNSGPDAGLGEIALPALQPESSIMPGKVNPVIPEAVCMACAQVIGNDAAIAVAAQSGNFQLNVMLPLVAYDLLTSIQLLSAAARALADKAIAGLNVNEQRIAERVARNPILISALTPLIGHEQGAAILRRARAANRSILDVALEVTGRERAELERLLDPMPLTHGGIVSRP